MFLRTLSLHQTQSDKNLPNMSPEVAAGKGIKNQNYLQLHVITARDRTQNFKGSP